MRGLGHGRRWLGLTTVVGILVIMGVGAAVAVAVNQGTAGELNYKTAHSAISSGTTEVKAWCPSRRHVTGGGFTMESTGRLLKSAPFDGADAGTVPDDGWVVGYGVTTGATETNTDVYAICDN